MQELTIYHNPRCSKSRQALEILQDNGLQPIVIDYIKSPLDMAQLKYLKAYFPMSEFVRTSESAFKAPGLSIDDEERVLKEMLNEPGLLQRPIVTYKGKAVIGRPPEKVLELFNS